MRLMSRKQPPLRTNERGWGPSTLKMNMNVYNEYVQEMSVDKMDETSRCVESKCTSQYDKMDKTSQ